MSQSAPAPELKTHNGNCHCGAFKYSVELPEITSTYPCNCSICFRKGYRWLFPGAGCFTITKGEGTLKEYRFGPKKMAHMFCGTCGTAVYGKNESAPPGMDIAINANTLQDPGVDVYDLKTDEYDGKAIDPQYIPPKFAGTEPTAEFEDAKTYYGSCHCGAVTVAMKTDGPLTNGKQRILECDCSICTRYGTTLTYPIASAFSVHTTSPNALTAYTFGRKFNDHMTCSTCGVSVYCRRKENIPADAWKKEKGEEKQEEWRRHVPVNLRCFEGVEWEALREKGIIKRGRWSQVGEPYVCPE